MKEGLKALGRSSVVKMASSVAAVVLAAAMFHQGANASPLADGAGAMSMQVAASRAPDEMDQSVICGGHCVPGNGDCQRCGDDFVCTRIINTFVCIQQMP